nr:GNAT family N-acetyltransferase [Lewinella sp. IMCC34191]
MDQSLRGMQNSTRAYRWSVPFLIVYDERSVVGTIGGKGLMDAESEVELGYNVALPFRGRGIASRAIAEMCLLAASDGLDLLAHVEPENEASRRALLRNDFRMEALVRLPDSLDLERWSWSPD